MRQPCRSAPSARAQRRAARPEPCSAACHWRERAPAGTAAGPDTVSSPPSWPAHLRPDKHPTKHRADGGKVVAVGASSFPLPGGNTFRAGRTCLVSIDVLPAVKLRGFPVPASCLVAHAANAVGWLVVEVRAARLCRIAALA